MRNTRSGARKYSTSVLSERNGRFQSSLSNQSYFRTFSSNSGPYSSRLGNSIDPTLQQRLVDFDKSTEELFIQYTKKQRDELSAFDRQWILDNGYELEATSHYLDVRNVEAREELQRQNEYLIRNRARSLNSIKRRQKQELQKFYNQRIRERNEIIESNEIDPTDTVMSIVRNRTGVQVFPRTKSLSQSNSQMNTRTKQIKVDIKKKNSKPSFFFSKTKFEDKDITIGRFKAKKKPKKEENPDLLDIDNLNRILSAKDSRLQRIRKEKELDETCKIYEFGELNPSGMSSAYISAAGSVSSDELSLQSSRTNGSTNIFMSAYDLQVEHFMKQEEKTNKEINEFIEKQDILLQKQAQSSLGSKSQSLIKSTKNSHNSNISQLPNHNFNINNNVNQNINDDYDYSDSNSNDDPQNYRDVKIKANLPNNENDQNNYYEYEYYSDDNQNLNNDNRNSNLNQNKLSDLVSNLKPIVDVDVNIFTKGLSSTSETPRETEKDRDSRIKVSKSHGGPENASRINSTDFNSDDDIKIRKNGNLSNTTRSKRSQTVNNIPPSNIFSEMSNSINHFIHQSNSKKVKNESDNITKESQDGNNEKLSRGKVTIHKVSLKNNNISNSAYNSTQGKQQFAFRTTLEMGINSISNSPIKLDKNLNDD